MRLALRPYVSPAYVINCTNASRQVQDRYGASPYPTRLKWRLDPARCAGVSTFRAGLQRLMVADRQ